MKDKGYAVIALKDILQRSLRAVLRQGFANGWTTAGGECDLTAENVMGGKANVCIDGQLLLDGWDLEFAEMSCEEQAGWLLQLFEVLVEHG